MFGAPVGTVNITANGYLVQRTNATTGVVVNTTCRVFNIHLVSSSTASVLTISNGQSGSVYLKLTGTISTGATFDFGVHGVLFPSGAYATVDGNIVSATIVCRGDSA